MQLPFQPMELPTKKKQHKTIFIKKKYMYNVMLHFFFLEKNNKTYQNVYTELRMLVCR